MIGNTTVISMTALGRFNLDQQSIQKGMSRASVDRLEILIDKAGGSLLIFCSKQEELEVRKNVGLLESIKERPFS